MESLNYLKSIINTMKPEEINSLEKFILYYSDNDDAHKSKSYQLYEAILKSKDLSANEIQKSIYGKVNYQAFNKLVNRLKVKTMDVLLFSSNLNRGYYSDRSSMVFELRKKIIQIDILILKGVRHKVLDEINLGIKKADSYEVYDVLVQLLHSKRRFQSIDVGPKSIEKIKLDIKSAEMKWLMYNESQATFNELSSLISISSSHESYRKVLDKSLDFLKASYSKTQSPTIGYYYNFLMVEKAQLETNYTQAGKYLNQLIDIIKLNKSVFSEYRMGSANMNLANNYLFLNKFSDALDRIAMARKYFVNQPLNLSVLREIELYATFYKGDISASENIVTSLMADSKKAGSAVVQSKIAFYAACIDFVQGNIISALNKYNESQEIEKDKEGWNIIKRIMTTLCRIELNEYESVELKLTSLDKFIKRIIKTKNIRPRYLLIVRILRKLINSNFDYNLVYQSRKKYFDLLDSEDENYTWAIKSPELVVFEAWFKFKMKKQLYDHKQVMGRLFS